MKRVVFTIGPQFAGKTTFCRRFVELFPQTKLVCMDEIRLAVAGTIYTEENSFGEFQAKYEMGRRVGEHLRTSEELLIFDAFFPNLNHLAHIVQSLRRQGAQEVHACHFVTPVETCIVWSTMRETDRHIPVEVKAGRISEFDEFIKQEHQAWVGIFDRVDLIDARNTVTIEGLRTRLAVCRGS